MNRDYLDPAAPPVRGAKFSHAQVLAYARNAMRILAEEIEAGFATRDTNDGSTYCSQCGAPQPRRGAWKHDPMCTVMTIRDRAAHTKGSAK